MDDLAAALEASGKINRLQRDDIWRLHDLIKHGAKIIDIRVRKDGCEHHFEADWLKSALMAVLGPEDRNARGGGYWVCLGGHEWNGHPESCCPICNRRASAAATLTIPGVPTP